MDRTEKHQAEPKMERLPDGTMILRRAWPQLGRMLYQLEHDGIDSNEHLNDVQKRELRAKIKDILLEHCSSYEQQYAAFEYVMRGRAVEIVGNPCYMDKDGTLHDLPYTGLEGYYVGSEAKAGRSGLTQAQIIEEEANIGQELLHTLKKDAIANYAWASFAKIADPDHHVLDKDDLKRINLLWALFIHPLTKPFYEKKDGKKPPLGQVEPSYTT